MTRITKPEELNRSSLTIIDFEEFSGFDDENLCTFPVGAAARVIAGVNAFPGASDIRLTALVVGSFGLRFLRKESRRQR